MEEHDDWLEEHSGVYCMYVSTELYNYALIELLKHHNTCINDGGTYQPVIMQLW